MRLRSLMLVGALLLLARSRVRARTGSACSCPTSRPCRRRATQAVDVSLDPSMLRQLSGTVANNGGNAAAVNDVIQGIRAIYVRSYSFDKAGEYSAADIAAVQARLRAPEWQHAVSTHDLKQGNNVDIYIWRDGKRTDGVTIIAAQPRELAIVNIVGAIDLAKLAQLQGQFGIPQVGLRADGALH